ncbi:uroporphyrin-III C-methyltransferase / precorrin-2 dehydrogenase / sirohydrochlorin ferrochelatase [Poseidonocella pacifica]|uniref:Uroporphyrin-III C-methyltransferase / precorrin-2 dehydrogenase / sirohydrochlorin ferrochelatase n=1 Tax=Poseidonocella pacifica TaxID=871651 RepID=A0A1I0VD49_9RHOB|nr:siroheme synthase CysG [Poseidonocella pacifica]SFA74192.1 uroporphyrin-III C-methyltransferase / precorrin-2 dehydrogenase / sirohydrochlorin ferrochelatase [Poseidonocella pacifica]
MKTFPMFLRMDGRRVVICGTGAEAARKARLVLKAEAELVLIGAPLDPELSGLVTQGRATHHPVDRPDSFERAALVFVATGDLSEDMRLLERGRAAGAVVNVVDRPDLCEAYTPSIVDRDPVVVAIGTEGNAPVLGRTIKTRLEAMLTPRLGALVSLAGRLRGAVEASMPAESRRQFWEEVYGGEVASLHDRGDEDGAARALKDAIAAGAPVARGRISLVGAGPGARDLLTLRAVRRLQEADVIFYDRLVDPDVLELARRDADRVFVGKEVGACAWPQDKIDRLIVAEAGQGKRVVRLKSGDPSIFGRAAEELAAARTAGIDIEIVPGVTAASAAASALGHPLTERGETDTLVVTTGTCKPGDAAPDRRLVAQPGTSVCFYMAVQRAAEVQADLLAAGAPAECPVDVVASASCAEERTLRTTLGALPDDLVNAEIRSPAILFLRYPKSLARASVAAA